MNQARLVRESQIGQAGAHKEYAGGRFVSRWEGGPCAFIIEIAKESTGTDSELSGFVEMATETKKRNTKKEERSTKFDRRRESKRGSKKVTKSPEHVGEVLYALKKVCDRAQKRVHIPARNLLNSTKMNESGMFKIVEEESKELAPELVNAKVKKPLLKKATRIVESRLKQREKETPDLAKSQGQTVAKESRMHSRLAIKPGKAAGSKLNSSTLSCGTQEFGKRQNSRKSNRADECRAKAVKALSRVAKFRNEESEEKQRAFKGAKLHPN